MLPNLLPLILEQPDITTNPAQVARIVFELFILVRTTALIAL